MKRLIFLSIPVATVISLMMTSCGKGTSPPINPNNTVVSTLAGPNFLIYTPFPGILILDSFKLPSGVAVDSSGNVYVADSQNNLIRKISPAGEVSTLAGSGAADSANGKGTTASFNYPTGVALDASGNVYVADNGNNMIRKISPSGMVTTLAGNGRIGSNNGVGSGASFWKPIGIALDREGNVYVADWANCDIRKINPSGMVTTLAGGGYLGSKNGVGSSAFFDFPSGVAVDNAGNVYVADWGNYEIRKIDPSGIVTTLAGSGGRGSLNGAGTTASFNNPSGVALDGSGNLYVADSQNNLIRKISLSGIVTYLAGTGAAGSANGPGYAASFNHPTGVAVDALGNVYVADLYNNMIRKISQ